jgi:hypothetical protein
VKLLNARDIVEPLTALTRDRPLPVTVRELAEALGTTERTLRYRCRRIGTSPKACLDFVRCLKVVASDTPDWNPGALLSERYSDCRTVKRLIATAGLVGESRPTVAQFLDRQQLLTSSALRATLRSWADGADN